MTEINLKHIKEVNEQLNKENKYAHYVYTIKHNPDVDQFLIADYHCGRTIVSEVKKRIPYWNEPGSQTDFAVDLNFNQEDLDLVSFFKGLTAEIDSIQFQSRGQNIRYFYAISFVFDTDYSSIPRKFLDYFSDNYKVAPYYQLKTCETAITIYKV